MELKFLAELTESNPIVAGHDPWIPETGGLPASKPYSSLEIELSTRCNLYCPSCARVSHCRTWIERDMNMECFRQVATVLSQFETVHLRGWGEPLANPDFSEMVRLAQRLNSRLILSTNGGLRLDPELLPCFDTIIYRLDYGRASTYERRNPKTRFNRAIFNISEVLRRRGSGPDSGPRIILLFAKNKYSLLELPIYLKQAIRLRPDRVVFYRPNFHVRRVDERGRLPADLDPQVVGKVDGLLESMARAAGLELINQSSQPGNGPARCVFDRDRGLFVNWNGQISVCRHTSLPVVGGHFSRFIKGRIETFRTVQLGSLLRHSLEDIVQTREYKAIRKACRTGRLSRVHSDRMGSESLVDCSPPKQAGNGKLIHIRDIKTRFCGCFGR